MAQVDEMSSRYRDLHMLYQSHITDLSQKIEYLLENYVLSATQDSFTFPDGETWHKVDPKISSLMQADGFPD